MGEAVDLEFELIPAAWAGAGWLLLTGRQPSLDSIAFRTVLRFALRRS
jgi:hypothetical protein